MKLFERYFAFAVTLLVSLSAIGLYERGFLFGHNDAMLYGRFWSDSEKGRAGKSSREIKPDVYQVCGAYPALYSTDLGGYEQQGRTIYFLGVSYVTMRETIIRHHRSGGAVTISWHVRNPEHALTYIYKEANHGTVARILQRNGKTYKTFMSYLDRIADFLLSLRDDDGNLIPILFRPWHECSGDWFWWGTADCTAEEYIELWRMTHNYLQERGLTNLRYVFSPGSWFRNEAEYMLRFPGREYVDIIGIENYRRKNMSVDDARRYFHTNMQKGLRLVKCIADSLGLPYAVTETGMQPDNDPQWWTLGLMPALEGYFPMYVNVWSNQCHELYPEAATWCTYPGEASARDFRKFYKMNKTAFIKKLKGTKKHYER